MDVTPLIRRDAKIIQGYKGGTFKVSNEIHTKPIFILIDHVIEWPLQNSVANLGVEDFALLGDKGIEVLLLGTGVKQIMLPNALRQAIKSRYGFTIDAMDNGAASRTYNVLMAEGRPVAAALIP
jgi:uncharacterized protein